MLYQEKITIPFQNKVKEVAQRLEVNPSWLMAMMHFETAGTFSAQITNQLGYTGLIQFGVATARELGTTTAQLRLMSEVEQMEYVYKYFLRYKSKIKNYVDMYLAVIFPVALGKSSDFVIQTSSISAEKFRNANPIFDLNKDGEVTVAEIEKQMISRIPFNYLDEFKKKVLKCRCCGQFLPE